jgi:hypothetical protein
MDVFHAGDRRDKRHDLFISVYRSTGLRYLEFIQPESAEQMVIQPIKTDA